MSKKYIKLIGPVFHNNEEYPADTVLAIPECITEAEADRLIRLGVAEVYASFVTENSNPANQNNSNSVLSVAEMTKSQCAAELTAAGVSFAKGLKIAELQQLVSDYRNSLLEKSNGADESDDDDLDINSLSREQLELELTARAIEFTAEQSDDELRQLLIDDESDDDDLDINSLSREQLELELTARAIEFTAEQSDDELRQLLIDDESDNDE